MKRAGTGVPMRPAPCPGADDPRAGFSLIEMLLVAVVVGILVQIVIPNYRVMTDRARAVDLMSRIETVATAARNFEADNFRWPEETSAGVIPPGLAGELPTNFSFTGENYQLDWENISIPGGLPSDPSTTRLLGVGVVIDDEPLAEALVDVFGSSGWYVVGNTHVFIIER